MSKYDGNKMWMIRHPQDKTKFFSSRLNKWVKGDDLGDVFFDEEIGRAMEALPSSKKLDGIKGVAVNLDEVVKR